MKNRVLLLILLTGIISSCSQRGRHEYPSSADDSASSIDTMFQPLKVDTINSVPVTTSPENAESSKNKASDDGKQDDIRGFDPASEDDIDDNGLSRYMENDDEKGWN